MIQLHVVNQEFLKFKILVTELALEFAEVMGSEVSFQPFPGEYFVAHWTAPVFPIKLHWALHVSIL